MRAAHAGVNHIGVDAGAVGAESEAAVERQGALIDPIEAPRDCALPAAAAPPQAAGGQRGSPRAEGLPHPREVIAHGQHEQDAEPEHAAEDHGPRQSACCTSRA